MNKVTGGDLPARIWRRFMLTAHKGLPARDFPFFSRPDVAPYMQASAAQAPVHEPEPEPVIEVEDLAADDPARFEPPPFMPPPMAEPPIEPEELPPF
jgi:penicillin-binding protein 1A